MRLVLTPVEHAELRALAEVVDPPHRDKFDLRDTRPTWYQPELCERVTLETGLPPGAVGYSYEGPIVDLFDESEAPTGVAERVKDLLECSPSLRGKLIAALVARGMAGEE